MKKSIFSVMLILIFAVSIFISCKTTPKPNEGDPGTLGWVTAARQRAIDFECPAYFPSDWEGLEAQYKVVSSEPHKAEDYNALADSYNALFDKTIPLYAQAREDELMAARESVVSSGFTRYFPEYLNSPDEKALAAQEQFKAGEYYQAKDTAAAAMKEYEELQAGAKVHLVRQEIIDRGFVQYDADNFNKTDFLVKAALNDYENGDKKAALTKADEALLRYNVVLDNSWTAYASDRRANSSKERDLALAERANVAARETFREAETFFHQADSLFKSQKYDDSAVAFTEAEALYAISRIETEEKRVKAEEALRAANERVVISSETAIEAERIIEGGSR